MALVSRLQPDSAVVVGALTAVGVLMIYNHAIPNLTDVRTAPAHDGDVEVSRKTAAIEGVALVVIVSAISRDLTPYIIGGLALAGMDYLVKHHNATDPATGKLNTDGADVSIAPAMVHSLPSYDTESDVA